MIITVSLVMVCYRTKILHSYWLYFPTLYISYPWHLFCNWKFVPLHLPHLFLSSPHPLSSGSQMFVLCIYNSCFCFVMLIHLFCFLYSTCTWNHIVFVFIWLISFSIILSRSIHVVANDKILFFFYGVYTIIVRCIYTTSLLSICLFMGTLVDSTS